jgi:hypothetical protein
MPDNHLVPRALVRQPGLPRAPLCRGAQVRIEAVRLYRGGFNQIRPKCPKIDKSPRSRKIRHLWTRKRVLRR